MTHQCPGLCRGLRRTIMYTEACAADATYDPEIVQGYARSVFRTAVYV